MKSFFNKLRRFNLTDYITSLERRFYISSQINNIHIHFQKENKSAYIDIPLGIEYEKQFHYLMRDLKANGKIYEFGINSIAIGVVQIWYKLSSHQKDPEFIVVNLHK